MRGVILAGGTGSRLGPLTKTINKHVLPVHDVPMIFHPLAILRNIGIEDITIVSSPSGVGQIAALLGSGHDYRCKFTYRVQDQPGGIAQALQAAIDAHAKPEAVAVILGDNVCYPLPDLRGAESTKGAHCFLHQSGDLQQLGVAKFDGSRIAEIIEKPDDPPSKFAVTGIYVFGPGLYAAFRNLTPSARGELEITGLLNLYASANLLTYSFLSGFWGDAGTIEGMAECASAYKKWSKE